MEIRGGSASAKLRQSNRNYKRIELTMQLLHSCHLPSGLPEPTQPPRNFPRLFIVFRVFFSSVTVQFNLFLHFLQLPAGFSSHNFSGLYFSRHCTIPTFFAHVQLPASFLQPVSSEISDLCEISDLLLFFSYFASQNKELKSGNYFFDVCCKLKHFG